MAYINSNVSVSELRIRIRTIGRITLSSGAMKFFTPVAPSQMDGLSVSSASGQKAYFYSIFLYKPILKSVKNLFLLCLLIDAHLVLVLAKFQVIAAILSEK